MAPGNDTETQFRFLISCIKHSTNGKVDFDEVRKECDIVSKAAAAKRFERLMKAHGINNGLSHSVKKEEDGASGSSSAAPAKRGRAPAKKRKLQQVDENADDDDEPIKGEVKSEDAIHVKSELGNENGYASLPMMPAMPIAVAPSYGNHELNGTAIDNVGADNDDDVMIVCASEKPQEGRDDVPAKGKGKVKGAVVKAASDDEAGGEESN